MPEDRTLVVPRPSRSAKARRGRLRRRRPQVEQWISEESSPICEVELIQQRLDIDAQLTQIDQAQRPAELEATFVEGGCLVGETQRDQRGRAARGGRTRKRAQAGWPVVRERKRSGATSSSPAPTVPVRKPASFRSPRGDPWGRSSRHS